MRKLVIGMAMASTALATPALARDGQWYVELGGGPMIIQDTDFDVNDGAGTVTVDTKEGYDFGGIVGYDFGAFRLEAETSWREGDVDALAVDAVGLPRLPAGATTGATVQGQQGHSTDGAHELASEGVIKRGEQPNANPVSHGETPLSRCSADVGPGCRSRWEFPFRQKSVR